MSLGSMGVTRQGLLSERMVFFFLGRRSTGGNDRFMENTNSGKTTLSDHLPLFFPILVQFFSIIICIVFFCNFVTPIHFDFEYILSS